MAEQSHDIIMQWNLANVQQREGGEMVREFKKDTDWRVLEREGIFF